MLDERGVSKGFGFVKFVDHKAALKAVNELNNIEIEGHKIFAGKAQTKK